MPRLADKVAIITGAGQGIGRATAERFVEEGASVIIAERDQTLGEFTATSLQERGHKALFIHTDVGDETSVQRMVAATVRALGKIDVLVNNAAVFVLKDINATTDEWRQILSVNVVGPVLVAKHVVPEMRKAGGGAIVNLGSISSFIAQPGYVTYNASKGAVAQITRCLAMDLAQDNIRVNAVCPGAVWTQIVQQHARNLGLMTKAAADAHPAWGGMHLLQRVAEPREIANAILFLASDEASFVTGENLMVDGGYTVR